MLAVSVSAVSRSSFHTFFCKLRMVYGLSAIVLFSMLLAGCGASSSNNTTSTPAPTPTPTPTPAPAPSYPTTPAEPITWTASTSNLPAPTAENPSTAAWGTGSNDFPLTVSNPTAKASVTSPFNVVASASPTNPLFFMRVYVDNVAVYYTSSNSINTQIFASPGAHTLLIMAEEYNCAALPCSTGLISATPLAITVMAQAQASISNIQSLAGWQSCSADFPAGSQRAGQLCAAGNKNVPDSTLTQNITSPAMDGKAAEFSMMAPGGSPNPAYGYSNYLYFNPVAGGDSVSNFTYDLYFYIDNPDVPQALEFDLNQGINDTTGTGAPQRWTWGSECNFRGETPGKWDIWDDEHGKWMPTSVPCDPFPANSWNHLTWNFHRNGIQVVYDTLTVNGTVYQVNTSYNNQQGWNLEEIDVAFQMDLDSNADPYNVWLDQVTLTAF